MKELAVLDACLEQMRRVATQALPEAVVDGARRALVDWFAVGLAGMADPQARSFASVVHGWRSTGNAITLDGRRAAAPLAALVNGAAAHTLDFDDFHIDSLLHPGAPTLAAALAVGFAQRRSGGEMLAAFVAGFEVGARCGLGGVGEALAAKGWHPTSVLGHLSATAASALLLQLDDDLAARALGLSAVQASGLMASAGTFAKPIAVGKAAMNGVMAAEAAADGASAPTTLLDEAERGLFGTLFQEPRRVPLTAGADWLILDNTFKPYPSCQLTHAAYDAAIAVHRKGGKAAPEAIRIVVNPLAPVVARHRSPSTVLEARFSIPYCVALGLSGRRAGLPSFSEAGLADPALRALAERVVIVTDPGVERWAARIEVEDSSGNVIEERVPAALGSLGRPMQWPDLESKFSDAVEPLLGSRTRLLLEALKRFDSAGASEEVVTLLTAEAGG